MTMTYSRPSGVKPPRPFQKRSPSGGASPRGCAAGDGAVSAANAGDTAAAERTLAFAVKVYPASVFTHVRHAAALRSLGRADEADVEMSAALLLDSRVARGWRR